MHVTQDPEYAAQFEMLLEYLRNSRAFDFAAYKRATLMRRMQRRMQVVGIEGFGAYQDYLEAHPEEVSHLFNMILINVTAFFRDEPVWTYLRERVVPALLAQRPDEMIRVWSAGCASGEEPCSLAMLFAEVLGVDGFRERVKIYATDVDEEALSLARSATYSERHVRCLPAELIAKYFERVDGRFAFRRDLRRSMIFGRHDLLQDAPISRIRLLCCRNTLMYLNSEAQKRVLDRFEFALVPGGYLVMGKAEMILERPSGVAPVDLKRRIFMKLAEEPFETPETTHGAGARNGSSAKGGDMRLQELAVEADPLAQFIVDTNRTVIMANRRARALFGITAQDIGRPIQDLEISYRPIELRSLLDRVFQERRVLRVKESAWTTSTGETLFLEPTLLPLGQNEQLAGVKVVFRDVTQYRQLQDDLKRSHQEVETAYEELQSTNEELETTNEELQSTVEELETTNEELQSTNEELETMNEELQSTNEELNSVVTELRERGDELNRANTFLESMVKSFGQAVIVLDRELRVQAWNARAFELWGLRVEEVAGRDIMNVDFGLPMEQLVQVVRECLDYDVRQREMTVSALTRRGRTASVKVTCSTLALGPGRGRGVILLMTEEPRSEGVRG